MNDNVLDFLRASFARQTEQLEAIRRVQQEHTDRLGRLEATMAGVRRDNADAYGYIVGVTQRLDGMSERLERIERRLDLADAAP